MSIEARPGDEHPHGGMNMEPAGTLWRRLAWFVALWAAGVATVGTVAYLLRWWIA